MHEVKLTTKGKAFKVGFKGADGKSAYGPLGERSEADLKTFLILAHRSRPDYVALFDSPPNLQDLLKEQADAALKAGPVQGAYAANANILPEGVAHAMAAPQAIVAAAEQAEPDSARVIPAPAPEPAQDLAGKAPAAGKEPTK